MKTVGEAGDDALHVRELAVELRLYGLYLGRGTANLTAAVARLNDARTEEAILRNMRQVFAGRSGIVVSHRVAAVRECDAILVLEGGRVTARGTHDELVQGGGYYARTAAAQSDAEARS